MKNFSRKHRKDLVVSAPDKGRGVVLVNKTTYVNSLTSLLSDNSKFSPINMPIQKMCLKIEDKINRFLLKLKKSSVITESQYNSLHVSGSGPGVMYGLPKIHKPNFNQKFQYRPILAAYNLASYKLSKFLVPLLSGLTQNQYTIQNSSQFSNTISNIVDADKYFMVSLDVESLFSNIPLNETVNICLDNLFNACDTFSGFSRELFKQLLELAVKNTFFIFDKKFYSQIEGVGMGLPLGPTFADIFLCHHEEQWLASCPIQFKPARYYRYVDDTFLLFNSPVQAQKFLASCH